MAVHAKFISLPRPLPLGEVDLRSKDGEGEAACLRMNPLRLTAFASSPEIGGALFVLTGRCKKALPLGELAATIGSRLRGVNHCST